VTEQEHRQGAARQKRPRGLVPLLDRVDALVHDAGAEVARLIARPESDHRHGPPKGIPSILNRGDTSACALCKEIADVAESARQVGLLRDVLRLDIVKQARAAALHRGTSGGAASAKRGKGAAVLAADQRIPDSPQKAGKIATKLRLTPAAVRYHRKKKATDA
jgi:hypothetical protein